jgi:hypothetical protein
MNFVIPKWSAHDVEDWDGLFKDKNETVPELNLATVLILNYMPIIGITKLTQANAIDAWLRISLVETIYGAMGWQENGTKEKKSFFVTQDDVIRHIGIETEGISKTFIEFWQTVGNGVTKVASTDKTASFIANGNRTLIQVASENRTTEIN